MPENKNALAELADKIKNGYVSLVANGRQMATFSAEAFPEISKAVRIIEELAKVSDGSWVEDCGGKFYLSVFESRFVETTIGKCRAIAEEGGANIRPYETSARS